MTSLISPTPGSTSRGSATSTISSGRPAPARHHHLDGGALDEHLARRRRREQHVGVDERVGDLGERDRLAADVRPRARPRVRACGSRPTRASTPRERSVDASPLPIWPAPTTSTRAPSSVPRCSAATATAADGIDTGWRLMPVSVRTRLPDSTACLNSRDSDLRRGLLPHRGLPRAAHLAEDLALADDHRVEAGRHREEVRDRGIVVVRVEVILELLGLGAGVRGEEVADVADRGMEVRAARVDLGAVAGREHHDLEQVLASGEIVQHLGELLLGARPSARAARPAPCGGSGRRRSETRVQQLLRVVDSSRTDHLHDARVERPLPIGVLARTPRRPQALPAPRRGRRAASRTRGRAPPRAGGAGGPRARGCGRRCRRSRRGRTARITDISVKEQLAGSSALLTQTRARLARRVHRGVDGRDRRSR